MKRFAILIFSVMLAFAYSCAAADEPEISCENGTVTVSNAPDNSTLILALYESGNLSGITLQTGSGIIAASVSDTDADEFKAFLWDMETIRPLCNSQSIDFAANEIYITVNDTRLTAELADNSSAEAFYELLKSGDITISMSDYGSFEKVGSLGTSLPRNDEEITTDPGDIILYQGNQITIYYDTNTWSFTRLARIKNTTQEELKELLGSSDVSVTFSVNKTVDGIVKLVY